MVTPADLQQKLLSLAANEILIGGGHCTGATTAMLLKAAQYSRPLVLANHLPGIEKISRLLRNHDLERKGRIHGQLTVLHGAIRDGVDVVAIDDMEGWTDNSFNCLKRMMKPGVRLIATCHPIGDDPGRQWIREHWSEWIGSNASAMAGEVIRKGSNTRTFFNLGTFEDNPYVSKGFRQRLTELPEPFKTELMLGRW